MRRIIVKKYGEDEWGRVPKSVPLLHVSRFWGSLCPLG